MELLCVFLPFVGALISGLFKKTIGDRAAIVLPAVFMVFSAIISIYIFEDVVFYTGMHHIPIAQWFSVGSFSVQWAMEFNTLSAVMVMIVGIVSAVVHVYSIGYMENDKSHSKFMVYLSFFTFAMYLLVLSDNLVQLFVGWEGVGLASYLLIGFWNHKESANKASIKAFVINRMADCGFLLGIFTVYVLFGTVTISEIFVRIPQMANEVIMVAGYPVHGISVACFFLFIGAMGKSAQLGFHTWLPDAMEGPTPVSALIHAATMVTAGVFMVARLSPLFEYSPDIQSLMIVVGSLTAFAGASVALVQFDIKKIIAYSTMSQLGYMFFALGTGAYGAAIFHLFTHAFFKALLFLGAGSIIHAMSGEQDIRKMGGIWKKVPYTYVLMWIGSLALAGIPWFAGYYSKDMLIEAAYLSDNSFGMFAFYIGIVAAFMTAFYNWRMMILVFHRKKHADDKVDAHVHESPSVMIVPLYVLGLGSLLAGWWGYDYFTGMDQKDFWKDALVIAPDMHEMAHGLPIFIKILPAILALGGIALAYYFYRFTSGIPEKICTTCSLVYACLDRKWFFDDIYNYVFEKGVPSLGRFMFLTIDKNTIDNYASFGLVHITRRIARVISSAHTGYLYHYAICMLTAVVLGIAYFLWIAY